MRFVILTNDYPSFLTWLYAQHPALERQPYAVQLEKRREALFSAAWPYASHFTQAGHESHDLYVNNVPMQRAWAREHGVNTRLPWKFRLRRGLVPWASRDEEQWLAKVLAAQIEHYKPDVLLNQAMDSLSPRFLRGMKGHRFLVGEHAATTLPRSEDYACYDLVVSSVPTTVAAFRDRGVPAESLRLGFDPAWLACTNTAARTVDGSFVGSFYGVHTGRAALVDLLCRRVPSMKVWAPAIDELPPSIRAAHQGPAWGREMYRVLACSKVTVNHHGDLFPYANNQRLYEATGLGALLLTDWKANLGEMFEPGTEVVTYRSADECADLLQYYLEHGAERQTIADAGRRRTLAQHTYAQRMAELVDVIERYA